MRLFKVLLISKIVLMLSSVVVASEPSLLNHEFRKLASDQTIILANEYQGKVVLVVNTASKCGNTPQYEGLEALYSDYQDQGFVVLGFPSNDFYGQEPGTEEEIQKFCRLTYSIQFPMFEKIVVKGERAHPFYRALADAAGSYPTWNFHKYLLGRDGQMIGQFSPRTQPNDTKLVQSIEAALAN